MRLYRGAQIAGLDGLRLRDYFRRYADKVNWRTLGREFSLTKGQAEEVLDALRKLKMISPGSALASVYALTRTFQMFY